MRQLIYILILLLLFYAPVTRLDVAKLEPVEVVFMDVRNGSAVLLTDTQAWGRGADMTAALEDMRDRTPGVVYLDTAQYLVITQAAITQIDALRPYLNGSVKLCSAEEVDMSGIAAFLEIHGALPTLNRWETGEKLPVITDGKIIE